MSSDKSPRTESARRRDRLKDVFIEVYAPLRLCCFEDFPEATSLEMDGVFDLLAEHITDYPGVDRFAGKHRFQYRQAFVTWMREWVKSIFALYQQVREMAPAFAEAARAAVPGQPDELYVTAAERVVGHVPELLAPNPPDLQVWGEEWAGFEADGLRRFINEWAPDQVIHKSIYRGLWEGLKSGTGCSGLGCGFDKKTGFNPLLQDLSNAVWGWAFDNAGLLVKTQQPGALMAGRLKERARFMAMDWKQSTIRSREKYGDPLTIGVDPWDVPADWEIPEQGDAFIADTESLEVGLEHAGLEETEEIPV